MTIIVAMTGKENEIKNGSVNARNKTDSQKHFQLQTMQIKTKL